MNVSCYLTEPPKWHEMYKSSMVGLNTCRLPHAFRENSIIREDWKRDFWNNATEKKGDKVIRSTIQNKEILITEQVIPEVLLFGDAADNPIEHEKEKVVKVLDKMSYKGSYPPTTKKLMHPYWRFLAHVYMVCISGNKSGIDTLTIRHTFGVVSLVEGWKFNYSKCVFDDIMANVRTLDKKYWFMFPRFIQMILEDKYSQLQPTVSIYDTKIMNHMVFSMLNQKPRTYVQVTYQNRKPLVKFGAFSEIIDAPLGSSEPIENVDLTEVESEEDNVFDESIIDDVELDAELNENVGNVETEMVTESLTAEVPNIDQPSSVNPPHIEPVETVSAEPENITEDPMDDLPPRKPSRRDPRISR
ncbi:hypothetical protein Hanom_Chr05g00397481 [Helianthus anomalus]